MATQRRRRGKAAPSEAADAAVYTQPSVRAFTQWTPALIRSAETAAESGSMLRSAELCDRVMSDDRIGEALETRTGGLMGLPLTYETARGGSVGDAKYADELEEDWFDAFPEDVLKQVQAWGIVLGIGWAGQVWVVDNGRFVPRWKFWHPSHFRWDQARQRWMVRVGDHGGEELVIEPDDPKWVCYTPYGKHRPWARGLWRGLSRWWLLKNYAIGDWAGHGEKASKLAVYADNDMARASATKSQRQQLAAEIQSAAKDAVIALPVGFRMELIEATANTRDIYGAQIEAANDAIVITINGQNLTTSVKGGSLAAANVHERVEARRIRSDGETLSTTVRSQSLSWWALWNFGDADNAPWPTWATEPPEDVPAKAEVFDKVASAVSKFKAVGLAVEPGELSKAFGLPEFQEVEPGANANAGSEGNGNGNGNEPGDGSAGDDTEDGSEKPQARATLASGITARSDGFVDGQEYADKLADNGREEMADHLREGLAFAMSLALEADTFEGMQEAVLAAYAGAKPPHSVAAAMAKLYTMAHRAGEVAVDQDA